ncbi:MAG: hypothetical protein J7L39_00475 [Candidatus Aenigmarchaeota archaeon]|nr:hypothetical protein [Candidatus Aenigmarchaeota archaeon]
MIKIESIKIKVPFFIKIPALEEYLFKRCWGLGLSQSGEFFIYPILDEKGGRMMNMEFKP